jgi:hypothetical protein
MTNTADILAYLSRHKINIVDGVSENSENSDLLYEGTPPSWPTKSQSIASVLPSCFREFMRIPKSDGAIRGDLVWRRKSSIGIVWFCEDANVTREPESDGKVGGMAARA